jgi:hypothetical protein
MQKFLGEEDMRFEVGQQIWWASWSTSNDHVVCPDCQGDGRLRVTFADDTTVSIACRNCASGYDAPTGYVRVYERTPRVESCTVTGYEVTGSNVRWRTSSSHVVDDEDLFDNEADCHARAQAVCDEANAAERDRVMNKEKDTRTWAWNASYHRREIASAKKRIEYHTAKLAVASLKSKEREPDATLSTSPA